MTARTMLLGVIVLAPAVWFLSLETNFALAPHACSGTGKLPLYVVSAVSLLLFAIAGSYSLIQFRLSGPEAARASRRRLALAGLGLTCLGFLLVLAQAIPNVMLGGCD